jgi:hypothetical protein
MNATTMTKNKIKIDLIEALWFFGKLSAEELPIFATQAINSGFDSPALRKLAGIQHAALHDVKSLFEQCLIDMGRAPLSKCEAGLRLAHTIAAQIVSGEITPYEGARKIWWDIWEECRELTELKAFVGLASGYEDEPDHRQDYVNDIVKEAHKLCSRSLQ